MVVRAVQTHHGPDCLAFPLQPSVFPLHDAIIMQYTATAALTPIIPI